MDFSGVVLAFNTVWTSVDGLKSGVLGRDLATDRDCNSLMGVPIKKS